MRRLAIGGLWMVAAAAAGHAAEDAMRFDLLIRGGSVYDGSGRAPVAGDVAIRGDRVAAVGALAEASAAQVLEAEGLAVSPGFINALSWSTESLIADGRSQGEVRQGVTTQIFGEGTSYGPLTDAMKQRLVERQGDIRYAVEWTTLAEYLAYLEARGIAQNVASFVGAGTVREHVIGLDERVATPDELATMQGLVHDAMREGALGVGSSLIYAPDSYASTEELIALCRAAAEHGGSYVTHMRSEGDRLLEAVDEVIRIARQAAIPAEIYHLKAAGERNWGKLDGVIERIETARAAGIQIGADMYTYTAGATGFDACVPPWSLDGGYDAFFERVADGPTRTRLLAEMRSADPGWENLCALAGAPERLLLVGFKSEALKPLTGRTLAEVAAQRGSDPENTILDLMSEDRTRVGVVFFLMSEENVRRQIGLPWMSFGSDAASQAPEGVFLRSSTHPRAYGNFARLLGRYVRDAGLIPLSEAIRRLTRLPADNFGLKDRGRLEAGAFADVVVFDPDTMADHATYAEPHQYATGVRHVLVNGRAVLRDGEHTGALPGRALRRGR